VKPVLFRNAVDNVFWGTLGERVIGGRRNLHYEELLISELQHRMTKDCMFEEITLRHCFSAAGEHSIVATVQSTAG
jgi:hypothetical protein